MREVISVNMIIDRNDGDVEVYVDGQVKYHEETSYGSDADGNRGMRKTIIDDVTEVMAFDTDGGTVDLTEDEIENAKESIANNFLEG